MTKQEKLAFRILASLYPDRKPSEIRKIIDKALEKEENKDDIELWAILTREYPADEPKKEETVREKIIERHYYHDHFGWNPSTISWCNDRIPNDNITITCNGTDSSDNTYIYADYLADALN